MFVIPRSNLEKMKQAIQEGKKSAVTKGNKVLLSAEENLNQMVYDLESARGEFSRAKSDANVMQEFKSLVEKGKEQLKKELESIVPDVKLGGKRGKHNNEGPPGNSCVWTQSMCRGLLLRCDLDFT